MSDPDPRHTRDKGKGKAAASDNDVRDDRQPGPSRSTAPPSSHSGGQHGVDSVATTTGRTSTPHSQASGAFAASQANMTGPSAESCLPILRCPCCSPSAPLDTLTTLRCGHTVCSRHLAEFQSPLLTSSNTPFLASCPVPTCRESYNDDHRSTDEATTITPAVPVSTIDTQDHAASQLTDFTAYRGRDVTVTRLINTCSRAGQPPDRESIATPVSDSATDTEDDDDKSPSHRSLERRRRHLLSHPASTPSPSSDQGNDAEDRFQKELMDNLTCEICFMLLYQPVTTPCQHTFCAKCLQRSLDHGPKCPLCRQHMPTHSYFHDHPYNKAVLSIIMKVFPDTYAERSRVIAEEERDARLDTPIFVCQLSLPGMPTVLHIFEPRYRLMLRRCLETENPSFGMILPPSASPGPAASTGHDFGTMLEIRNVRMYPDGRSLVETVGSYRFRVIDRGVLDGYMVGKIERIDDIPEDLEMEARGLLSSPVVTADPSSLLEPRTTVRTALQPSLEELLEACYVFVRQVSRGAAPWVVQRLNNTYGPMPTHPYAFSFWMALILPIDEHEKAKLLPMKSAYLRLRLIVHWIEQLNNSWWFSGGCCIC